MPSHTKVHLIRRDGQSLYCGNKHIGPRSTKEPVMATCVACLLQYYKHEHVKELEHPILKVLARKCEIQLGRIPVDFFEVVDFLAGRENLALFVEYIESTRE